ncbi:ribosomal RNA small subunit methyltransferase B [Bartonella bacilliformis str. Heidi Mejia]|uniref:Ribosomal RNA small subunit methyltransferase B n=2 Tax=Bartonella bacilliformis TaxID=774 RepID=A0ABP2SPX1_BARBA|nr:RsmB/NOP family class I SAM-dependent RNA methyltransferase [Bartonella bacilliformis]ABM45685.1 putative ribosomal RNA small subunit methyltransferase B [Bartonella bacilliformis KC583]AMG85306.1 methyltransferase domain-containing protein [Bartonella bacilliformis]EKS45968.1 putative ribosomal RNA small subunit methyltransferase B [Bartonella bacilliformis INS]EYS88793.1 ribosomal RNA small subunit methyltransferase B [Bartonella bacilliformis San Pedro600-02]EYS90755.1 ribosomal RNA smal
MFEKNVQGLAVRQVCVRLLGAVLDKHTSLSGLTDHEHGHPLYLKLSYRDRLLCRAILIAALRHRGQIQAALSRFLTRPLPSKAFALQHLFHISAAQILYLDIPDYAAIDLAVRAAKIDPRTRCFSGLVNAILRNFARDAMVLKRQALTFNEVPDWFWQLLVSTYGEEKAQRILAMQSETPPLDLTVKSDSEGWAKRLGGVVLSNGSVRLKALESSVVDLPGYAEGAWWVQDVAAALPARFLGDIHGKRVADLCASPGGKTAQLALQGADVTAVDLSANRLKRLTANMHRLNFSVSYWNGDVRNFHPEKLFDAVLLDAPCSSLGTIRRHPDILWIKSREDIMKLAAVQYDLLLAAIAVVKKGGHIVFSNCSLAREEGEDLIEKVLATRDDVVLEPILENELGDMKHVLTVEGIVRTTPADFCGSVEFADFKSENFYAENKLLFGMDGFYAARLRKIA